MVSDVPDGVTEPSSSDDVVAHRWIQKQDDQGKRTEAEQPSDLKCQDAGPS